MKEEAKTKGDILREIDLITKLIIREERNIGDDK